MLEVSPDDTAADTLRDKDRQDFNATALPLSLKASRTALRQGQLESLRSFTARNNFETSYWAGPPESAQQFLDNHPEHPHHVLHHTRRDRRPMATRAPSAGKQGADHPSALPHHPPQPPSHRPPTLRNRPRQPGRHPPLRPRHPGPTRPLPPHIPAIIPPDHHRSQGPGKSHNTPGHCPGKQGSTAPSHQHPGKPRHFRVKSAPHRGYRHTVYGPLTEGPEASPPK